MAPNRSEHQDLACRVASVATPVAEPCLLCEQRGIECCADVGAVEGSARCVGCIRWG